MTEEHFEKTLKVNDNHVGRNICGPHSEFISLIQDEFGVGIQEHSPEFTIIGDQAKVEGAFSVLEKLSYMDKAEQENLDRNRVLRIIKSTRDGFEPKTSLQFKGNKTIKPRTLNQERYLDAMRNNDIVFGLGAAGTGKTYLAVAYALHMLDEGKIQRIILTRPAVEAGERLGFLPGDMEEKIAPYLQPLFDALRDLKPDEAAVITQSSNDPKMGPQGGKDGPKKPPSNIEIAPLAFMRGRTLKNAMVILDEAQNTTAEQMKMFLTRLGEDSKMVVTGDPSQIDLPGGQISGLVEAIDVLEGTEGMSFIRFEIKDVQRHQLVGRIIDAYEKRAKGQTRENRNQFNGRSSNTGSAVTPDDEGSEPDNSGLERTLTRGQRSGPRRP